MKRFLAILITLTMILSCSSGLAFAEEHPQVGNAMDRIFFVQADSVKEITYEDGKAIFPWSMLKKMVHHLNWGDSGVDVYLAVDPERQTDSSGRLLNADGVPVILLTKDKIKEVKVFDGASRIPADEVISFHEDGKVTLSRDYLDKAYTMYIDATCCGTVHYNRQHMVISPSYGKGNISYVPDGWEVNYDDLSDGSEAGFKTMYVLFLKAAYTEPPEYIKVYAKGGLTKISMTGKKWSDNGYWIYPVNVSGNFTEPEVLIVDFGESVNYFSRLGCVINPGTENILSGEPEEFDVREALDYAQIDIKTSKVSKGIKVKVSVVGINKEAFAEAGYTLKLKYYRSTKKSSGYKLMASRDFGKTYTNSKGTKGKKYYYKVKLAVYDVDGKLAAETTLKQSAAGVRTFKK